MSYSPISAALESIPGIPGTRRAPIQLGMLSGESDPDALIAMLSRALVNGTVSSDVILGAIAEAAQALTSASGAALAVQSDGVYVCRARSGEIAPVLGAQLKLDSGISGECLRTGNLLRCDDTQNDYRVDPEVCFRMGIRSIAVTPLRGRRGPIGILEVFSSRAYAFTPEHTDFINRLAVIAEAAQEPAPPPIEMLVPYAEKRGVEVVQVQEVDPIPGSLPAVAETEQAPVRSSRWMKDMIATAGALALAAGSFLLLQHRQRPSAAPASRVEAAPAPTPPDSTPANATAGLSWQAPAAPKPSPAISANRAIQRASKVEIADVTVHPAAHSAAHASAPANGVTQSPARNDAPAIQPPALTAQISDKAALGSLLSPSTPMPKFAAPVSQGVSPVVIERKVQPIYPPQAFALRLEGQVILMATVAETGKVESVKVISGNAILAQAGADAVRQWRYRPFVLDGKPIRMQTQVTLNFKAP